MRTRLTRKEKRIIKELAQATLGECEVYGFGRRLEDKKGGDIDLYVVPAGGLSGK